LKRRDDVTTDREMSRSGSESAVTICSHVTEVCYWYNSATFLYGCEMWSLTLRKEHRQKMFENRVLRRIFGPNKDEATGEWSKLHNEELHNLY
jgi:hypothetical protein